MEIWQKRLQYIVLSCCLSRYSYPPFFAVLKDKKRGNSDYNDRIALIKQYIEAFGRDTIECILGDREFIGKNWITWLDENQIPYVIRIKENGQYISKKAGKLVKAASLFKSLQANTSKYLGKRSIGKTDPYMGHITGLKTTNHQLVVLLHSPNIKQPCEVYQKRWQIEVLFKVMKTSGFNLEATHLTHPQRLETLLGVAAISACLSYQMGILHNKQYPPKIKNHGYKPFNTVRIGLDYLTLWIRSNFFNNLHGCQKNKIAPLIPIFYQFLQVLNIFVV